MTVMRDILIAALLVAVFWLALAGWSHRSMETLPHDVVLATVDEAPGASTGSGHITFSSGTLATCTPEKWCSHTTSSLAYPSTQGREFSSPPAELYMNNFDTIDPPSTSSTGSK